MTLSENIKRIRKEKGLTQKKLGELCNIDEANIRKYENGKQTPKIETLEKIANALQCPVYELMEMPEKLITFREKIDVIKKINDMYLAEFSFLAECDMTPKQIKDYIIKCKIASEQISNYVTESKAVYEHLKIYMPKYELADIRWKDFTTKRQSDTLNANTEVPEELKKLWKEYDIALKELNNPMGIFAGVAKKLITILESEPGTETLFHIAEPETKTENTKNTKTETSLTDIQSLFCKLNANGKKEIYKRLEELTHLEQYTDK